MLVRLKQLVSSIFILVFISTLLGAKEIPITQEVSLTIPVGSFSVIEFPFKITSKNITSFLLDKPIVTDKKTKEDIFEKPIQEKKKTNSKKKKVKNKKLKYMTIKQNINSFTFFPKKEGVLKIVIWGYDHPILLTIEVKRTEGHSSYQFVVPHSKSKEIFKTEQGSHEKIINMIMVNLFNQTLPRGYKNDSRDYVFNSNGFRLRLNREVIGRRYIGQEWILTNTSNQKSLVHEESFYQKDIYGVSLETSNLKMNESIRVFIVRKGSEKRANYE